MFLSSGNRLTSLHKVVLHVALEVEVGELVILLHLEKLGELIIGVDAATILLVLETIGLDVGVNLLAHVRARHLSANRLAKELGKLVTDAGGLDKARGLAVDVVAALLGGGLLGILQLTGNGLLEGLEIVLDRGEKTNKLLELGVELSELKGNRRSLGGGGISDKLRGGRELVDGGLLNLGLLGTGLSSGLVGSGLNNGGGSNNGSSDGSGNRLRRSNHSGYYILLSCFVFKLFFC